VVIASSDKAYGTQPALPYTEDMPLQGQYPYEVSKSCADLITQSYYFTYGLPVAIARCGNIYGGGDLNWSRLVPGTIRSLLHHESPILRSDGTFVRDYIYVKDVCGAYLALAENLHRDDVQGQAFNFGPEAPLTVLELVKALQELLHCEHLSLDIRNSSTGEIRSQYLSSEKAHRVLGWQSHFTLKAGLEETIAWYRRFFNHAAENKGEQHD
jgi:CDP-glucose 4,6-dehydratase